jgi:predicted lipoprotein with Yx(FWY)xxD motif
MKKLTLLLVIGLLALAGCGDEDDSGAGQSQGSKEDAAMKKEEAAMKKEEAAMKKEEAAMKKEEAAMKKEAAGTRIVLGDSEFGEMLFSSKKQAIYIFENDPKGKTVCYGECAEAWPPVLTKGKPKAGDGVKASLLSTVKRRDGKLQVTYAGKPLYFYSHEGPGEVRCHNVDLNGGFWWVVGPDGNRRA